METSPASAISSTRGVPGSTIQIVTLQGQQISPKLDDANFLLWKQQVMATLGGHGLEGFLSGADKSPQMFLPGNSDGNVTMNPDYEAWNRQDKFITSWLLGSMTESILVALVGLDNTKDIWDTLESNFASQSRAKLMQLKFQLQTLKKGSMSMREYLNKVKSCCDVLAAAGERVSEDNHILHILTGLGAEYNAVMVSITSRVEPCSLREATSFLVAYENRLETTEKSGFNVEGSAPSANVATHSQGFKNNSTPNGNGGRGFHNSNNGRGGGRGYRGRGRHNGNWKPRCQICHDIGHTADKCHERNNPNFIPNNNRQNGGFQQRSAGFNGNSGNFNGNQSGNQYGRGNTSANMASMNNGGQDSNSEMSWYPDSGASNHITYDYNNLNQAEEYQGAEKLQMGNGAGRSNRPYTP